MNSHPDTLALAQIEFITFSVAKQKYCVEIKQIREIRRWSPVSALPHSPADVLGVMNLRGSVIAIFDLAARFGIGKTITDERNVVIVAALHDKQFGLLVDSVSEIVSAKAEDIQETPDVKSDATRACIQGVISIDGEMARVINLAAIVDNDTRVLQ